MTPLKPIENLFAVEVPGDALPGEWKIFEVDGENYLNGMTANSEMYAGLEPLPPGSYETLFTTLNANASDAEKICSYFELAGAKGWRDYQNRHVSYPYGTALQSLQSLLRSNGLDASKNYLLIKKTT